MSYTAETSGLNFVKFAAQVAGWLAALAAPAPVHLKSAFADETAVSGCGA
jgi:hypothetical protein